MSERMTDERLVTVSEWLETESTYMKCTPALAKELLQALKAEHNYAAELEAEIEFKDAIWEQAQKDVFRLEELEAQPHCGFDGPVDTETFAGLRPEQHGFAGKPEVAK